MSFGKILSRRSNLPDTLTTSGLLEQRDNFSKTLSTIYYIYIQYKVEGTEYRRKIAQEIITLEQFHLESQDVLPWIPAKAKINLRKKFKET